MSLETATYLNALNASYPPSGDPISQADDHLRLIKSVLQATFPNLNAAVTATPAFLNQGVPAGVIAYWYGSVATVPAGWGLCNGTSYTKSDGSGSIVSPNLSDKFIYTTGVNSPSASGGAATATPTITVANHTLITAEMPSHVHAVNDPGHGHNTNDPGHTHQYRDETATVSLSGGGFSMWYNAINQTTGSSTTGVSVLSGSSNTSLYSTGGDGGHNHTATSSAIAIIPPFYVLAIIMKL